MAKERDRQDDPPETIERYSKAAVASRNMRMREHGQTDGDVVAAAGMVGVQDNTKDGRPSLGVLLARLRAEWDLVVRQHQISAQTLHASIERSAATLAEAKQLQLHGQRRRANDKVLDSYAVDQAATRAAWTDRVLLMTQLKSLRQAKLAMLAHALQLAKLSVFIIEEHHLTSMVGQSIEAWLNPLCPACGGAGSTGGVTYSGTSPQKLCRWCKGSGVRPIPGRTEPERWFTRLLISRMEQHYETANARMDSKLFGRHRSRNRSTK